MLVKLKEELYLKWSSTKYLNDHERYKEVKRETRKLIQTKTSRYQYIYWRTEEYRGLEVYKLSEKILSREDTDTDNRN